MKKIIFAFLIAGALTPAFAGVGVNLYPNGITQSVSDGLYVAKAGTNTLTGSNTLTGPLTLSGSSLTVTGNAFSVGGSTLVVTGGKVTIGGNASTLPKLEVGGNILVNGVGAGLDIYSGHYNPADGTMAVTIGGDLGNVTRSATSRKSAVINSPSYTLSGHPTLMFWQDNNTTTSDLLIGGGNGYQYASTHIGLFTAANNTTDAGTERLTILSGGNVGIGTTAPLTKLVVSSGVVTVDGSGAGFINKGFSTLGESAPAIKMITISTTTAMTEGGNIIIAHGLTASKIIAMSAMALVSTSYFPPNLNYSAGAGYEYQLYHNSNDIIITNHPTLSENILNKPLEIVITYKE